MEEKKKSKNREKKEQLVAELSEKIGKSKAMVFTNYQGLTHKQLEELKKALRDANAELVVTKNTLLKLSLDNSKIKADEGSLNNPTAALFAYEDTIAPLKHLAKTIKSLGLPTIKFGIMDGQALDSDQVLKLASLPSKEVLLAQVVGGLKSPIFGLHRALSWNIQKLVMTLDAVAKSKPAATAQQPEVTAAPATEPAEVTEPVKEEAQGSEPAEAQETEEKKEEPQEEKPEETEKSEGGEN
jgi:large subunit ribosomal protein L10